jgi:hypothetical protein
MTKSSPKPASDPPALIALRRAAKAALEQARAQGTPCYVLENGRIIDIAKAAEPKSVGPKRSRHTGRSTG